MNSIIDPNMGRQLYKFGTFKIIYIFENGFVIRGIGTERVHYWHEISVIEFSWDVRITNIFAYNHNFTLGFHFKNSTIDFKETWSPGSIYIDFPKKKIKGLLNALIALGIPIKKSS